MAQSAIMRTTLLFPPMFGPVMTLCRCGRVLTLFGMTGASRSFSIIGWRPSSISSVPPSASASSRKVGRTKPGSSATVASEQRQSAAATLATASRSSA